MNKFHLQKRMLENDNAFGKYVLIYQHTEASTQVVLVLRGHLELQSKNCLPLATPLGPVLTLFQQSGISCSVSPSHAVRVT